MNLFKKKGKIAYLHLESSPITEGTTTFNVDFNAAGPDEILSTMIVNGMEKSEKFRNIMLTAIAEFARINGGEITHEYKGAPDEPLKN